MVFLVLNLNRNSSYYHYGIYLRETLKSQNIRFRMCQKTGYPEISMKDDWHYQKNREMAIFWPAQKMSVSLHFLAHFSHHQRKVMTQMQTHMVVHTCGDVFLLWVIQWAPEFYKHFSDPALVPAIYSFICTIGNSRSSILAFCIWIKAILHDSAKSTGSRLLTFSVTLLANILFLK